MKNNIDIEKIAVASGFHKHPIHGLILMHSNGSWMQVSERLKEYGELYYQAKVEKDKPESIRAQLASMKEDYIKQSALVSRQGIQNMELLDEVTDLKKSNEELTNLILSANHEYESNPVFANKVDLLSKSILQRQNSSRADFPKNCNQSKFHCNFPECGCGR